MKTKAEITQLLYGTTDERLATKRANRRARQAKKSNRRIRDIFKKPNGLASR
jgi:hypothetical protein